nr:PD-(D/E)XK nuclease family protein [Parerythrobacter lacustris]
MVAGLVPRYSDAELGLARLTLLLPSSRAMRTVSEAFIRHYGAQGRQGLLLPRMAVVGDLDLDETLGPLLDPLGAGEIAPAIDPTYRWLRLAQIIEAEQDKKLPGAAVMRLAYDMARTMDRLLIEDIRPEALVEQRVLDVFGDLSGHWQDSLRLFARVQQLWLDELGAMAKIDSATRRNRLFDIAARRWREEPPTYPVVAAGVTSASPALARLLRVVANLPNGAVILPDFDLSMDPAVWNELGGAGGEPGTPFEAGDAVTHPQYHLKLLLNRMGIAREEVQPWHRKGLGAAPPERSHAISNLFLPPEASQSWVDLDADKRRLTGVRIMESANPEEEAQAIALLVRQALEVPERRVAVVTPDRGLARRVVHHLRRWNIAADDSAGQPLSQTPSGRLLLLLAEVMGEGLAPIPLMALLAHPLVRADAGRGQWLANVRAFERELRGPRPAPGSAPLREIAAKAAVVDWWGEVEATLAPLLALPERLRLADAIDLLAATGEALCGAGLWSREDGRALAAFLEQLRAQARETGTQLAPGDLHPVLAERMEQQAVRPPYGGHPRVAIYGLLESRMTRAELVICAGLNEGSWPGTPAVDPILAPRVLRALGVPGADFRIGLSAHDLAGVLGAPEVVLSRAARNISGPAIPSRFLLRVKALLGEDLLPRYLETRAVEWAQAIDFAERAGAYPRPMPMPSAEQRQVDIAVTALDRLRGDPYQFYAQAILGLRTLDPLDAEPSPAWQGTVVHEVLERWHKQGGSLVEQAHRVLAEHNAHPLMLGLWLPRLLKGLEWVEQRIVEEPERVPVAVERKGSMLVDGIRIKGRADRIDRLPDGRLAIVDYKTGKAPTATQVTQGFSLQLGLIGMIAEDGGFEGVAGEAFRFEYWSLAKDGGSFGKVSSPVRTDFNRADTPPEEFLPLTEDFLAEAIGQFIRGDHPFTARLNPNYSGYDDYDQLMRLDEWQARVDAGDPA